MTGKELKSIRLRMGLNQTEMGRRLGYANPQIRISLIEKKGGASIHARLEKSVNLLFDRWKRYGI